MSGRPTVLVVASVGLLPSIVFVSPSPAVAQKASLGRKLATFAGTHVGQIRKNNGLNLPFVWIPPGDFTMGSPKTEKGRFEDEDQVQVTLTTGFWLGQHEVTQAEWRRVMHSTPWSGKAYVSEGNDYPATYVSWNDALKFCEQLTVTERSEGRLPEGWRYTLPTEAQWEYACRGGTKSRFSFGSDDSRLEDYAWFDKNAGSAHLVGQKQSNPFGLYDMHGNVWEWCCDYYAKKLAGGTDPQGPSAGSDRVRRGGGWDFAAGGCRSAGRDWGTPSQQDFYLGFRTAAVQSGK
jgi:formylglycine-generating enzyme